MPRGVMYGLMLILAMVTPVLGLAVAAIGAWLALLAGSIYYLPLGLMILLAGMAILRSPLVAIIGFAVIATLAGLVAVMDDKGWIPAWTVDLASRMDLMIGMLVLMVLAFMIVHWQRFFTTPLGHSRLVWLSVPLLLLAAGCVSVGSLMLARGVGVVGAMA